MISSSTGARYRKRPIIVEAVQWQPGLSVDGISEWKDGRGPYAMFTTIHNQVTTVLPGDWLIRESDGVHWYPCKPDIFAATYEAV